MTQKVSRSKDKQSHTRVINASERFKMTIFRVLRVLVFIVPLIVHLMVVPVPEKFKPFVGSIDYAADFFVAYKVLFLLLGTFVLLLMTLYYQIEYAKFKPNKTFYSLLGAFAIVIVLSLLFSEHKEVAFWGYNDRYEGALTWLAYLILAYITYLIVDSEEKMDKLKVTFIASAGLVAIIGVFQFFGMDFFKSEIGKMIILGSRYAEAGEKLIFPFPDRTVYSTLFNSNYVGSMMVIALILTMEQLIKKNNWIVKGGLFILLLAIIVSLVGSKSTGGLIATGVALLLLFIVFSIKVKVNILYKVAILIVTLVISGFLIQSPATQTQIGKLQKTIGAQQELVNPYVDVEYVSERLIIHTDKKYMILLAPYNNLLDVTLSDGQVLTSAQTDVETVFEGTIESDNIKVVLNTSNGNLMIGVIREGLTDYRWMKLHFRNGKFGEGVNYITEDNVKVSVAKVFSNERLFTDRGYIWNRVIPLILKRPILGYGPDNFTMYFPQVDLIGSVDAVEIFDTVVDKPHNMYLGLMMNFGILGALVILSIVAVALVLQRSVWNLAAIVGFMIAGFVNDSVVTITFIVAILIAMGLRRAELKKDLAHDIKGK